MKKSLLILTFACSVFLAHSQNGCTPDPQYVGGGIYPPAATFNAPINQPFSQILTAITPSDTDVVLPAPFGAINANILSMELTNVTGLPPNFMHACDPVSCVFPGGTTKCAEVYSTTDPTISDVGFYPITFEITAHLDAPFVGAVDCVLVETGYAIQIGPTTSVIHQFHNQTFELKSLYPNPVTNQAVFKFIAGKSDDIIFRIYNVLGRQVYFREVSSNRGVNSIEINAAIFPNGIYMYSIDNGEKIISKRMLVAN